MFSKFRLQIVCYYMSVNKVILVGNLGKDPEVRYLEGGTAVASFSIATSEKYKDRNTGERITQTEWHNIVLWRGLAEVAEKYLKKGSQVYIEGKLKTRSWEDQAGVKKYTTEVVADTMTMLGSKNDQMTGGGAPAPTMSNAPQQQSGASNNELSAASSNAAEEEDDLPF